MPQRSCWAPSGKVRSEADFIFYNQLKSACGSVQHTGDNRTGAGEGDDEAVMVDLTRVPADVQKITFTVTIHDAEQRASRISVKSAKRLYPRWSTPKPTVEVARYDSRRGRLDRNRDDLRRAVPPQRRMALYGAVGQGYAGGLTAMCRQYGINI
jgi:tellurium resistance protein TerD